jgi:hypothetical protein
MGQKMQVGIGFAIVVAFFAITSPAHADWQYTKWGMNVTDALRASRGELHVASPAEAVGKQIRGVFPSLLGSHQAGAFRFDVAAFFRGPGQTLDLIHLTSTGAGLPQKIITELRGKYGEPIEDKPVPVLGRIIRFRDERGNTGIEVFTYNDTLIVNYAPLRGAGSMVFDPNSRRNLRWRTLA